MLQTIGNWLFDPSGLTPHGFCLLWQPWLIWLHAGSDTAISLAYFSIPLALAIFASRRRDLVFRPLFWLFTAFILLCGTGHAFNVLTLWYPAYGAEAVVKLLNAAVSVVTAVALWRLLPQALALASPGQLRDANEALRQSEARHRVSFVQSPVPMHVLDRNGVVTSVSNSWLALLGYSQDEVIGRRINDFAAAGSSLWVHNDVLNLMEHGEVRDLPRHYVRRDGGIISALVSGRLDVSAGAHCIVCVLIDITARQRAEEALQASEEKLRQAQKMEAVGQLTGGVAHDFNNMLQGIAGGLDLMERRIEQGRPGEVGRYIGVARRSVERAAGLTTRMLAFARRQVLQPRPVDPGSLVTGMAELIGHTLGPATELRLHLAEDAWPALCDDNQLENALLNLAINARDAMPGRGTLTIQTANQVLCADDIELTEEAEPGDYVMISVSDNGSGMTPEIVEHAFEPFFTTKPLGHGTGLGLSQIYGFVRQSGGLVRLVSEPGVGTTVSLFLPRASAEAAPAAPEPLQTRMRTGSVDFGARTVLVVEDEDSIRELVTEALIQFGCNVMQAADGPSALRTVQSRQQIDLLITDVGLPGINGRELADAVRRTRPDLPVLITTGYAGQALTDMQLSSGMEILQKPFSLRALSVQVASLLEAHTQ